MWTPGQARLSQLTRAHDYIGSLSSEGVNGVFVSPCELLAAVGGGAGEVRLRYVVLVWGCGRRTEQGVSLSHNSLIEVSSLLCLLAWLSICDLT